MDEDDRVKPRGWKRAVAIAIVVAMVAPLVVGAIAIVAGSLR